jgi:hypothetical protein
MVDDEFAMNQTEMSREVANEAKISKASFPSLPSPLRATLFGSLKIKPVNQCLR